MTLIEKLCLNNCISCHKQGIAKEEHIDTGWRDSVNNGLWPKPYQKGGINPETVKGIVIGQDPTIDNPRKMEFILEANTPDSNLGKFLREAFGMLPEIKFDELYFTNLVKCRLDEKPGKDGRNISDFLKELASNCFSKFLLEEINLFHNAKYIFTLGRDTFNLVAKSLLVKHQPLSIFNRYYGTRLVIPSSSVNRTCYLVPLPHQNTYDIAQRYGVYGKEEMGRRLAQL